MSKEFGTVKTVGGKEFKVSEEYFASSSKSQDSAYSACKVCGNIGLRVLQVTVLTHTKAEHWNLLSDGFRFCNNYSCPVIYFNNRTSVYFAKDEVKTRFGMKERDDPRPICYCLGVMEEHIRYEALKKGCCDSLEDIVEYTKAGTGKWCLTTNPSGKCCRDYLPIVVERYLSMKETRKVWEKLQQVKERLEAKKEGSKEVTIKVGNMTCDSCVTHVRTLIERMGGRDVNVSLEEGLASFIAPLELQTDEVTKAIEESGYTAVLLSTKRK